MKNQIEARKREADDTSETYQGLVYLDVSGCDPRIRPRVEGTGDGLLFCEIGGDELQTHLCLVHPDDSRWDRCLSGLHGEGDGNPLAQVEEGTIGAPDRSSPDRHIIGDAGYRRPVGRVKVDRTAGHDAD